MKKSLFLIIVLVHLGGFIFAQEQIYSFEQLEKLSNEFTEISEPLLKEMRKSREQAFDIAFEKGWTIRKILPTGEIIALQGMDKAGMPIYYSTDFNTLAAATTSTNKLWPGGSTGLNLSGSSSFLEGRLAIWDGGSVLETHQEFSGRILLMESLVTYSGHATHVAGTMIAAGINPYAKGMAFGATRLKSWDFDEDGNEMQDAAAGLILSNHSYGRIAGWRNNTSRAGTQSDPSWEWYGNINVSATEDYNFGYYDSKAKLWDMISYYHPYYLIVKSAGNNRNTNGPAIGNPFWRFDALGNRELISSRPAGISNNDSYDIIATYGTAKNILTIGAVNPIDEGYKKPQDVVISAFSSWGPTDDGRIKPDLVANGVSVYSTSSGNNNSYSTSSGTSMSAPNTSGTLILLQEHFHLLNNRFMLSSTLRGLVCHTADDAGNIGPDYIFGWGLLNAEKAANVISSNGETSLIEELLLNSNQSVTRNVIASGKEPLIVTIAWIDPEAEPLPINVSVLNNRTPRLINDLYLRVQDGNETIFPWVLNLNNPGAPAIKGDNLVDNIEQVVINNPIPGKSYTITISHKGSGLVRGPQIFSLIATGIGGEELCISKATNSADSRIDRVELNTISNHTAAGCQTYRDFTTLSTNLQKGGQYNFRIQTGTCGNENPRIIKLYADWNSNGIFEAEELVAVSPVINTSGTFSGTMTVPGHVIIGATAVFRVVLTDTNNPENIIACGEYAKGETQDYLLIFDRARKDIGPVSIIGLENGTCSNPNQYLEIRIENFGKQLVVNFEIEAKIYEDGDLIKTLTGTYINALGPLSVGGFLFEDSFTTLPDKEYSIIIKTILPEDQNSDNDQIVHTFNTAVPVDSPEAQAFLCSRDNSVQLSAQADGFVYWYDSRSNGKLLATGSTASLAALPSSGKVFAASNYLSGNVGPANRYEAPWTGGGYSNFPGQTFFTTYVPLVIKSARLHVGNPGEITIYVEDFFNGEIAAVAKLIVSPTTDPVSGEDPGRVFPLNLNIEKPGTYRMLFTFGAGTTLFRANSQSSNPYPYSIPGVISFTQTNQTNSTGFYYYLYNMQIGTAGCASALIEVDIQSKPSPVVDLVATRRLENGQYILDAANPGSTYLWNTGATTQTIAPQNPGVYTVIVTNKWGCKTQGSINITVTGISNPENLNVRVYPNPSKNFLFIESPEPVLAELINLTGQKIFISDKFETKTKIQVNNLVPGIYILRVTEYETRKQATYKVIIQ